LFTPDTEKGEKEWGRTGGGGGHDERGRVEG